MRVLCANAGQVSRKLWLVCEGLYSGPERVVGNGWQMPVTL